jgi:DNA polymerase elongation subunit (family B)/rubredoxin
LRDLREDDLAKILLIDIETAPNKVYSWGLWDQNIATNQVMETSYVLSWAAKWYGEREVMFDSVKKSGAKGMMKKAHQLLNEADIVVHYNGLKFDVPTLNKEFIQLGFAPPAPYKQIDCMKEVKRMFRFQSNKLDFVSQALGIGSKAKHEGFSLWVKCMEGDAKAWRRMERYNRQDVRLLEKLYIELRPWIEKHPNIGTYDETLACPKCGGLKKQRRGYAVTQMRKYPRYQCLSCGGWFRGNKTDAPGRAERAVNIV